MPAGRFCSGGRVFAHFTACEYSTNLVKVLAHTAHTQKMYTSTTRRVGTATPLRRAQKSRARQLIASTRPPPSLKGGTGVRVFSRDAGSAAEVGGGQGGGLWSNVNAQSRLSVLARGVPSASSIAGAVALVPVVGGVWFVSVFALRQRLCEHHLQQVCGVWSAT